MEDSDSEDEAVALSSHTMDILNQFLAEKKEMEENTAKDPFAENWAMSQFWYTDETADRVANEMVRVANGGSIACMACPSLFRKLREKHPEQQSHLFEFDTRFEVLGSFTYWDYNDPLGLPASLHHSFSVLITDPPYLSSECLEKSIKSLQLLGSANARYFALTGASVRDVAYKQLGLRPVRWRPEHKNKLGNEFCFYTADQATAEQFDGWDT